MLMMLGGGCGLWEKGGPTDAHDAGGRVRLVGPS